MVGEIFQVAFNTPPTIRLKARPEAALCPQSTRWLGNRIWLRAFPQAVRDSSRQITQENDIRSGMKSLVSEPLLLNC